MEEIEKTLPRQIEPTKKPRAAGQAYLLVVFDCQRPLAPPSRHALRRLRRVRIGRGRPAATARDVGAGELTIALADAWASSRHAELSRDVGGWAVRDCGSTNGLRINGHPTDTARLRDGDLIEVGRTLLMYREVGGELDEGELDEELTSGLEDPLATLCAPLRQEYRRATAVAASGLSILLHGETGTGKEVVARELARHSGRQGAFVAVNCGALAPTLVESELFGHAKGAFTGASAAHQGLIRAADGGTLFLDEIGDLHPGGQAALLRVLQEREVRPVGATRSTPVDIRLLSATHRELDRLVAEQKFRADLLARLQGFRVRLPPLRARREDLGLLVARLLRRNLGADAEEITFEPEAARFVFEWSWPLNVRQLDNTLAAAVVLATGKCISLSNLRPHTQHGAEEESHTPPGGLQPLSQVDEALRARLLGALTRHAGNVSAVARDFGKARTQIQRWVKRFGVNLEDYRKR